MAYEWTSGETITAAKLNATGPMIVHAVYDESTDMFVLDKTWQEIHDAVLVNSVHVVFSEEESGYVDVQSGVVVEVMLQQGEYGLSVLNGGADAQYYATNSANGYPSMAN